MAVRRAAKADPQSAVKRYTIKRLAWRPLGLGSSTHFADTLHEGFYQLFQVERDHGSWRLQYYPNGVGHVSESFRVESLEAGMQLADEDWERRLQKVLEQVADG